MKNSMRPQVSDVLARPNACLLSLSPVLAPLLRGAARILGLDADDSARVAQIGAFELDGMIVSTIPLASDDTDSDCDVALVSPLIGASANTVEQMRMLLEANLLLIASGYAVGSNAQGELHLVHSTQMAALSAPALARKLERVAAIAAFLQSELTARPASAVKGGGFPSGQTGRRTE